MDDKRLTIKHNKSVLLIGNHLGYAGLSPSIGEQLAPHLVKRGWAVLLVSRARSPLIRLGDMLKTIILRSGDYQIAQVDVFSDLAFIWAELCTRLLKILSKRVILSLHGGDLPVFSARNARRVASLLQLADGVTAPSGFLAKALGDFRSDIEVIPNGLDISAYPFRLRSHPTLNLVWLRSFHRIYNPNLAPRLMAELKRRGLSPSLKMIGPDKGDGSLQEMMALSQSLGVGEAIEVVGGVAKHQVGLCLAQGDIFINTTHIDNTPVSVLEAMACGLCIVSTNVGGVPDLVDEGVDGLLVSPDDPVHMADALERICQDPVLAARLSQNARQKAERCDWEIVCSRWETRFQQVMQKL